MVNLYTEDERRIRRRRNRSRRDPNEGIIRRIKNLRRKRKHHTEEEQIERLWEDIGLADPRQQSRVQEAQYSNISQHYRCKLCGGQRVYEALTSDMVCTKCSVAQHQGPGVFATGEWMGDTHQLMRKQEYQPEVHFADWLKHIQGRSGPIPMKVLDLVLTDADLYRVGRSVIDAKFVRRCLRRHRQSAFYRMSATIAKTINPALQLPDFSAADVAIFVDMFSIIKAQLLKYGMLKLIGKDRHNVPCYPFFVRKILSTCGFHDEAATLQNLTTAENEVMYQNLYTAVAERCGWHPKPERASHVTIDKLFQLQARRQTPTPKRAKRPPTPTASTASGSVDTPLASLASLAVIRLPAPPVAGGDSSESPKI